MKKPITAAQISQVAFDLKRKPAEYRTFMAILRGWRDGELNRDAFNAGFQYGIYGGDRPPSASYRKYVRWVARHRREALRKAVVTS